MIIPAVNDNATDRDRELTMRIVEALGEKSTIPNGSLTLDQAVAMLKQAGVEYDTEMNVYFNNETGFVFPVEIDPDETEKGVYVREIPIHSHDLTATLEALLKVVKGESK